MNALLDWVRYPYAPTCDVDVDEWLTSGVWCEMQACAREGHATVASGVN